MPLNYLHPAYFLSHVPDQMSSPEWTYTVMDLFRPEIIMLFVLLTSICSGHTHVAEALKVPIHIFFTMPWTWVSDILLHLWSAQSCQGFCQIGIWLILFFRPTSEFPHPLSRVKQSAGYRVSLHPFTCFGRFTFITSYILLSLSWYGSS